MNVAVRLSALALLTGASAPLQAQAQADPARLDEFAVTAAVGNPSHVDQLAPRGDRVEGSPQPRQRAVTAPQPSAPRTTVLRQVSSQDQASAPTQLSTPGAAPDETRAAVSSTADSRPRGVAPLGGHDRCDPQLAGEERARCRRILELRAQEFHAPAPPQLSAEQRLLAEQRGEDESSGRSPGTRLRLASRDAPDADLQSNQELAALYLGRPQVPQASPTPQEEKDAVGDGSLAAIVQGLLVQTGGAPPP